MAILHPCADSTSIDGAQADGLVAELALLKLRALRYARQDPPISGDIRDAVVFTRGEGRYAALVTDLREIRPLRRLCRIPRASPIVPGVLYYRGEILSAHDLGRFLVEQQQLPDPPWVLVLEQKKQRLGLLADTILGIASICLERLSVLPVTLGERGQGFYGIFDGSTLLLNPACLLSMPAFTKAF